MREVTEMGLTVVVRPDPPGKFTAIVVGLPEIRVVADTEGQAVEQVRATLAAWLANARWVSVTTPVTPANHPWLEMADHSKDDPDFDLYLGEITRHRQEMDERECSNTSSTPTT